MFASTEKPKPIAIVVPAEKALREMVEKSKIDSKYADLNVLAKSQKVKEAVMKEMLASGKAAGLQGIELISGIILSSDIWTPENVSSSAVTLTTGFSYRSHEAIAT